MTFWLSLSGKTQGQTAEAFPELVAFGQEPQSLSFRLSRRIQGEVAITDKNCARDSAGDRRNKAHGSGVQNEGAGIPVEGKIADRNRFSTKPDAAQLLIGGIGIRSRMLLADSGRDREQ
jgi:hypothetical protein